MPNFKEEFKLPNVDMLNTKFSRISKQQLKQIMSFKDLQIILKRKSLSNYTFWVLKNTRILTTIIFLMN